MGANCDRIPVEREDNLELVWDEDLNATAFTAEGHAIQIGPQANLSPDHLLALAASSCLMTTFLELAGAAGVVIQAYLSSARVRHRANAPAELAIASCAVIAQEADRAQTELLWEDAIRRSPTLSLLNAHLQVECSVRVATPG